MCCATGSDTRTGDMELNRQQQEAVDMCTAMHNVHVTAVPGAGKTRTLLEMCRRAPGQSVIMAYNHDLCAATRDQIRQQSLEDRVMCFTFHGLSNQCIQHTFDDVDLHDAVEAAECGDVTPTRLRVSLVLIDEAQDMKTLFFRLLTQALVLGPHTQYVVVGDPDQMLYGYDEDDPAISDYLAHPEECLVSSRPWSYVPFLTTHRLPPNVANFVSTMFQRDINSAVPCSASPVQVHSSSLYGSGALVNNIIRGWAKTQALSSILLLVPSVKQKGAVCRLLNYLSGNGLKLNVWGLEGDSKQTRPDHVDSVHVATYHASKGTEARNVIVFGLTSRMTDPNPLYVALTRCTTNLAIVQDLHSPHPDLMRTISTLLTPGECLIDDATRALRDAPPRTPRESPRAPLVVVGLDGWRPRGSGRWMRSLMRPRFTQVHDECHHPAALLEGAVATRSVYRLACCMCVEYEATGAVRILDDMQIPLRFSADGIDTHIRKGGHAHVVSARASATSLLATNLLDPVLNVYQRGPQTAAEWCLLACAAASWNQFHHTMRQLLPVDAWVDVSVFEKGCHTIRTHLEPSAIFDTRVCSDAVPGVHLHARCMALCANYAYVYTWNLRVDYALRMKCTVVAALARKDVMLVNLHPDSQTTTSVHSVDEEDRNGLLRRVYDSIQK